MPLVQKKSVWNQPPKTISWFKEFLGQHKALVFALSTKENNSGVVTMNRAPVVFCPPQLPPPHFSDKGLKLSLIPTPTVSVKTRSYRLPILGLRQPWLTLNDTLFQSRVVVTLLSSSITENQWGYSGVIWGHSTPFTSYPGDRNQLWHSQEWKPPHQTLLLRYTTNLAQLLPLFFLSILSGFWFCFTAVQDGIRPATTPLSLPTLFSCCFSVLPWLQGHLPSSAPS